ncbi:developmentally Regulated MAPK Interacting protein [Diaporthe helianthi]|uniref:Developmentally Regulated MAPK Interacting protein n=1 Tax=Diaporthe helianthi TaxID=158607 RepID=A0A2P5HVN4_DIAHE|nr:developmentally Regulated MAPK Interacting protein [Diaporthe helianthi]
MAGSLLRSFLIVALAISCPVAQAIQFNYPKSAESAYSVNLSFLKGDTVNVTWDSVASDPEKFSLYLWEFVNYPPAYELVAYNVETEAGQASFKVPCHIEPSSNWQITMIEGTNVYVLYGQTARFKIESSKRVCDVPEPYPEICSSSSSYDE